MKKLVLIFAVLFLGTFSISAQSSGTGYVQVTWNSCDPCCVGMEYYVCITIERISDHEIIVENLCSEVEASPYTFSFDLDCSENEYFKVYASVRAGCDGEPPTECCYGKNSGVTASCSDLNGGSFSMSVTIQ
jgi:hypothetical protein